MSLDPRSDAELVIAYRAGDERVFAFLVARHLTSLYRFLLRMTSDPHTAQDLSQETFLKAWKHLSTFDAGKSFKTWLFSIAHHTAIDHLRKHRPVPFADLEDEDLPDFSATIADTRELPHTVLERQDLGRILEDGLATLPPKTRATILMHEREDMTFQEIADATKEPMNTVKSRYRRALASLRERLLGTL
jgi:RNA polymerase sigma-70 factor (ECF subfamily)